MPHLKRLRITLPSSNIFGCFIGLYFGVVATFGNPIRWIFLVLLICGFALFRFGDKSAVAILVAFLFGYGSQLLKTPFNPSMSRYLVVYTSDNYVIVQHGFLRLYLSNRDTTYQIGDILEIAGYLKELDFGVVEGQFDFERYLFQKGVSHELIASNLDEAFLVPFRLKTWQDRFLSHYDRDSKSYLSALLFGHQDDSEITATFSSLNLIHVLNISGILAYGLLSVIRKVLVYFLSEKKAANYSYGCLVFWLIIAPQSIALWRIFLGGIVNMINVETADSSHRYWHQKGLVGIILVIFSRYIVNSPAFYLSYIISIFLYLTRMNRHKTGLIKKWSYRLLPWIPLVPFLAISQGKLNIVSMLLFIPLAFVHVGILTIGLIQFYTFKLPFLITPLIRISSFIINLSNIATLSLQLERLSLLGLMIYCVGMIVIFLFKQMSYPRGTRRTALVVSLLLLFDFLPLEQLYQEGIFFINVGQGDAILVRQKRHALLIDTGGSLYLDIAATSLIPFFNSIGVTKIDTVIITHDDFDHNGALPSLVKSFRVDRIIEDTNEFPYRIGTIDIYNLNKRYNNPDSNMNSLVLYFSFMNQTFLLMGDAPIEVETQIISNYPNLDIDYLKIGHHGSNTATSAQLLDHVTPMEAIISVGRNYYGHPHAEVLKRLQEENITIRRTDLEGTIAYT